MAREEQPASHPGPPLPPLPSDSQARAGDLVSRRGWGRRSAGTSAPAPGAGRESEMKRLSPQATPTRPQSRCSCLLQRRWSPPSGPRLRSLDNGASPLRNNPIGTDPWLNLPPLLILTGLLPLPRARRALACAASSYHPSPPRPLPHLADWRKTLQQEQRFPHSTGQSGRRSELPPPHPAPFPGLVLPLITLCLLLYRCFGELAVKAHPPASGKRTLFLLVKRHLPVHLIGQGRSEPARPLSMIALP